MESRYLKERRALKLTGKPTAKEEKAAKTERTVFFANQILTAPSKCENCGAVLHGTKAINPRAIVAHILPKNPKSGCPSVALHPLNKFFACGDCHTDYDNKGAQFVMNMPIFETLKDRVAKFYNEIAPGEKRRVPPYFVPNDQGGKK